MSEKDETRIPSERAELISIMRPGDSLWECPRCRVQVLVEGRTEFRATCTKCETQFVRVELPNPTPLRDPLRGH